MSLRWSPRALVKKVHPFVSFGLLGKAPLAPVYTLVQPTLISLGQKYFTLTDLYS